MNEFNEKEIRENYQKLTKLLIEKHLTITTMESATSGQIASLITDTQGSSAVLKGALIAYSNEAKISFGVPAETIEKYSVYSCQTAEAMALACSNTFGADIGIGVSGTFANPDPTNLHASVPGEVFFAIVIKGSVQSFRFTLPSLPSRLACKLAAAEEVRKALMAKVTP